MVDLETVEEQMLWEACLKNEVPCFSALLPTPFARLWAAVRAEALHSGHVIRDP